MEDCGSEIQQRQISTLFLLFSNLTHDLLCINSKIRFSYCYFAKSNMEANYFVQNANLILHATFWEELASTSSSNRKTSRDRTLLTCLKKIKMLMGAYIIYQMPIQNCF